MAEKVGCSGEQGTLLPCLQVICFEYLCHLFNAKRNMEHSCLASRWLPNIYVTCPVQGIEDGFALLEAFDYGPYPVVDKVLLIIDSIITWFRQSLGEDAFLPSPPREILNNGEMLPLDLIIGFNHDEGLEAIVDLLKDPDNDTNFAKVLIECLQTIPSLFR